MRPGAISCRIATDALVHGFDVFRSHLVVEERTGGLRKIRIRTWDGADRPLCRLVAASLSRRAR